MDPIALENASVRHPFLPRVADLDWVKTATAVHRNVAERPRREHFEIKACGGKIGEAEHPSPDFDDVGNHGQIPWLVVARQLPSQVMPALIVVNRVGQVHCLA